MSENYKLKFTIDTCLVNVRKNLAAMNVLEQWHSEGKLELVGAQRFKTEVSKHPFQPEADIKAASITNISEPCVWGIGEWGHSKWGAEGDFPTFQDLASVLFPTLGWQNLTLNQTNDVMHLMGHVGSDSFAFLTNNTKDFIVDGRQETLKATHQIIVMTPDEAVEYVTSLLNPTD